MYDASSFVPILILVMSVALLFIYAAQRGLSAQRNADEIVQVGASTFVAQETAVGSIISILLVLCVAFYGRVVLEANDRNTAEALGAWQFGFSSTAPDSEESIARWLLDSEARYGGNEDLLDLQTNLAISLSDRHQVTRTAFNVTSALINYTFGFIILGASVQGLLLSRHLHGLRLAMPLMLIMLLVTFFYFSPGAGDFARMLWKVEPGPAFGVYP